ncbi:zinc ABC transporter solute-binding protein [Pseudodesulfovibrio sp. JC047]|uniref:metal ABC transporter solute-binding protein, Zn/Mn family n=1 Tax=Pseudodesulfovibrio sp. JC047 TaxID=2683199 RepID=UPI0013D64C61|nr:zinc ABC transporter substrate-binding protein [Pseudodesulfovibrio sp. JC047]NDV19913.1 zinc ABC transporter solute-binding protein [Pseudodesulfovibrio sp. JC047]
MTPLKILAGMFALILLTTPAQAEPLSVTVSIAPLKYFTESIGGDRISVEVMVQPGASPATYEPKPRQMVALSAARLYLAIGVPFERTWLPRIQSANPDMPVVNVASGLDLMPMATHRHDADHEKSHGHTHGDAHDGRIMDPHVWNSPAMVRQMAQAILTALTHVDPEGQAIYQKGYTDFLATVQNVDTQIKGLLGTAKGGHFLTYHPSWGYFARDYGLIQVPVEMEGKNPGPKELAAVINLATEESITAIFVQPQFSAKSARIIAEAIHGQVVEADPLAEEWADNMVMIARQFSEALR